MARRLKAVLQYDGGEYRGWQRQPDAPTVQETCERALGRVLGEATPIVAAGRTDTGVHARAQVVHFDLRARITARDLRRAWNTELPRDIWVQRLGTAPRRFHARHDAVGRTYRYFVAQGPRAASPFVRRYAWAIERPLDWSAVDSATRAIAGTHDFRLFAKGVPPGSPGESRNPAECTVYAAAWRRTRSGRALEITADRFLRHMVRALVGALIAVGRQRLDPAELARALRSDGRRPSGRYAPACGLFLWRVDYEPAPHAYPASAGDTSSNSRIRSVGDE